MLEESLRLLADPEDMQEELTSSFSLDPLEAPIYPKTTKAFQLSSDCSLSPFFAELMEGKMKDKYLQDESNFNSEQLAMQTDQDYEPETLSRKDSESIDEAQFRSEEHTSELQS